MLKRVRLDISGKVQGVGFRYFVKSKAKWFRVNGWVRNTVDGKVEAVMEGREKAVEKMIRVIKEGPPLSRVDEVKVEKEECRGEDGFAILKTDEAD